MNINLFENILSKGQGLNVFQKNKLDNILREYEKNTRTEIRRQCEEELKRRQLDFIDTLYLTIIYNLHFGDTKFGKKRLDAFMKDLTATIDMFNTKEYSIKDYIENLKKDGIELDNNLSKKYDGGSK